MRPTNETSGKAQYECFACGHRQAASNDRTCERCGGRTRNLGVSRDL